MADIYERLTKHKHFELFLRILTVLVLLYFFLVGVKTLSGGLKMMGEGFAQSLFDLTSNPFISLMAGMLATVLFQSSSVTTSIIVGLVAAGTISVGGAIPMIMGANIGTSVTNTLVSLGYVNDNTNFKRAFAAATVHDFFNILSVLIILPFEIMTGFMEKSATYIANMLYGSAMGMKFSSPVKMAIKPAAKFIKKNVVEFSGADWAPIVMVALAGAIIILALTLIIKVMSNYVASKEDSLIEQVFSKNPYATVLVGVGLTIMAQSSSITTSLLIPMAGSGLLTLNSIYPVTVGANIGTTATALLAAMTGNVAGLIIAIVHLMFNILGTLLFFVSPRMRQIPIYCAETLAASIDRTRAIGIGYVATVFFVIPVSMIFITQ